MKESHKSFLLILLGLILISLVFLIDIYYETPIILSDEFPSFGIKNMAIFSSLALICVGYKLKYTNNNNFNLFPKGLFERLSIYSVYFISCFFILLFIFKPGYFIALSFEDYPIEWISALSLFGASVIFFILFVKSIVKSTATKLTQLTFLLFSTIFFVICMEEVSWLQRVFKVETTEFFDENLQKETNFHNFYTTISEYLYYLGAFVFLVLAPFLKVIYKEKIKKKSIIDIILPSSFIISIGSITCAYNLDMWNSPLIQVSFFSCIIIILMVLSYTQQNFKQLLVLAFILILTKVSFVIGYKNVLDLLIVVKEYKEFFIAISFFIYASDVYFRIYKKPKFLM